MLLPHPLQYPKIIQKVQNRRNNSTRRRSSHRDLGRNGEPPTLLRININERRNEPRDRIKKPDPIPHKLAHPHLKPAKKTHNTKLTEKSY